jgi:hypothetical protein
VYHQHWLASDTCQPFFYWLDFVEVKSVDLPELPRRKLNSAQLHYCTPQERATFAVMVNDHGLLQYAHSQELVHTLSPDEDAMVEDDLAAWQQLQVSVTSKARTPRATEDGTPSIEEEEARKEAKRIRNANKWIFVTSTDGQQLFVAPKVKGNFQHSSFLSGGSVGAAGAIAVHHGQLLKLAPMSGHYTPDLQVFLRFLDLLSKQGVDLSKVLLLNPFPTQDLPNGYTDKYKLVNILLEDHDDHQS